MQACDKQGSSVREIVKKEVEETTERMNRLKQRERSEVRAMHLGFIIMLTRFDMLMQSVVEANVLGRLSVNMLRQVCNA